MTGVAKEDTHKPLFQDPSSSSLHPHTYILTVAPSVIPPLLSSLALFPPFSCCSLCLLCERKSERGPRGGTIPSFRETVDPTAERGSLHGGQPTPLPQTSQPSATAAPHTHPLITQACAHKRHRASSSSVALFFSGAPFFSLSHISPQIPAQ